MYNEKEICPILFNKDDINGAKMRSQCLEIFKSNALHVLKQFEMLFTNNNQVKLFIYAVICRDKK